MPGLNPDSAFVVSSACQPSLLEDQVSRPSFTGNFERSQTSTRRLAEVTSALIPDCPLFADDCSGHIAAPRQTPKRNPFWVFNIFKEWVLSSGFIFCPNRKFTHRGPLIIAILTSWPHLHSKQFRHTPPCRKKRCRDCIDVSHPAASVQPDSCELFSEATTVAKELYVIPTDPQVWWEG